jgi:hypothetical protein
MEKDRDQLTPDETEDRGKLRPHRSAAREASEPMDRSTGRGPGSSGGDPPARDELAAGDDGRYR